MKISVIDPNHRMITLECDDEMLIEDLKALIEIEMGFPMVDLNLVYQKKSLKDKDTLKFYKIKDGDLVNIELKSVANMVSMLTQKAKNVQFAGSGNLGGNRTNQMASLRAEAENIKKHYESNPADLQYILHQNPVFAQAVLSENINDLINYIAEQKQKKLKAELEKRQKIAQLNADPFNLENQKLIEEEIRMERVDENLTMAQEYIPEVFGSITMLYIDIVIEKTPIQAFVDSGAQSTIMSKRLAEKCGIMNLVDKRFAGKAVGVGTARILGRVHAINLQVADKFIMCSLTILDDDKVDFLLGLDMLKRHRCCIDLNKNVLVFNDVGIEVPFLAEKDIERTISMSLLEEEEKEALKNQNKQTKTDNKQPEAKPLPSVSTVNKPQNPIPQQMTQKSNFPLDKVMQLTSLGFSVERAVEALTICEGDVDMACSYLLSTKFQCFNDS